MQAQCSFLICKPCKRNASIVLNLFQRRLLATSRNLPQYKLQSEDISAKANFSEKSELSSPGDDILRKSQRQYGVAIANCRADKNVKRAMKLLQEIKQQGVVPSVYCYTAAIGVLGTVADVKGAEALIKEMELLNVSPNLNTYTNLMSCQSRAAQWQSCMNTFEELQNAGHKPDARLFSTLITALSRARQTSEAIRIFNDEVLSGGSNVDLICFNAVIGACAASPGEYNKAYEFFTQLKSFELRPDAVTYTLLMKSCRNSGKHDLVSHYFEQMLVEKIEPNGKILANLVASHGAQGQMQEAVKIYEDVKKRKSEDTLAVGSTLVHTLAHNGNTEESLRVISELCERFSPNKLGDYYTGLLNSLYILDEIEALDGMYHETIYYEIWKHWADSSKQILDLRGFNVAKAFAALRYALREISLDYQEFGSVHDVTILTGQHTVNNQLTGSKSLHDEVLHILQSKIELEAIQNCDPKWTIYVSESNLKRWLDFRLSPA